jgi:hypothetical protein
MSTRSDDEIRNYVATNRDCIEDEMVLIEKEELPNDNGASGFIKNSRTRTKITGVVAPVFSWCVSDQYCLMLPAASRSLAGLYPASCRFLM